MMIAPCVRYCIKIIANDRSASKVAIKANSIIWIVKAASITYIHDVTMG